MMNSAVGIGDLAVYIPQPCMPLETLVAYRVNGDAKMERRLRRAVESTGQRSMRYPQIWEDNATLAAQASHQLLNQNPELPLEKLRYIAVGTETSVDLSKPVSAYVEGMLQTAGHPVPDSISTFQVQHACAGGTISIMSVGALLCASAREGESGMVICSDIARYESATTAEITQGAGAVAMLVETNPRLVELDISTQGYCSRDVDDFFRPLGSVTAKVKGGYSVQCYHESLDAAFRDHCARTGESPREALEETDMFVLHIPFQKMAWIAIHRLLSEHLQLPSEQIETFLNERGFAAATEPAAYVGNIYSGAAYLSLAFYLKDRFDTLGDDIVGKRILLASYGSGNTMSVIRGRVAAGAPGVIRNWNLDTLFTRTCKESFDTYEQWLNAPLEVEDYNRIVKRESDAIPSGSFYLAGIRNDGYREYSFK